MLADAHEDLTAFTSFPVAHWRKLLERVQRTCASSMVTTRANRGISATIAFKVVVLPVPREIASDATLNASRTSGLPAAQQERWPASPVSCPAS